MKKYTEKEIKAILNKYPYYGNRLSEASDYMSWDIEFYTGLIEDIKETIPSQLKKKNKVVKEFIDFTRAHLKELNKDWFNVDKFLNSQSNEAIEKLEEVEEFKLYKKLKKKYENKV